MEQTAIEQELAGALAGPVREALGSRRAEVIEWRCERAGKSRGAATSGVYCISGTARDRGEEKRWRLILKVVALAGGAGGLAASEDEGHALYWRREALVYRSGMLEVLPGGFAAPSCFGVEERAGGSYWLWLEHVEDRHEPQWPLEQYASAARTLGRFNGAYLAGTPMPDYPWLTAPGSLRGTLEHFAGQIPLIADERVWQHPMLWELFPVGVADRLLGLWADRGLLLAALDRLPQTLAHKDAFRGNLYAPLHETPRRELVAIDWAYPGSGHIGLDPGDLSFAGFMLFLTGDEVSAATLDTAVFDGYMMGLKDSGWRGDRDEVRFAYAAYSALKYGALVLWLGAVADPEQHAPWERLSGRPMREFLARQASLVYYLLDLADEARRLLGS